MPSTARQPHAPRSTRARAAVVLAALLVLAAACGGDGGSGQAPATSAPAAGASADPLAPRPLPQPTPVTFLLSTNIEPFAAPLLAQELGEFEAENLQVDLQIIPPNEGMVQLLQGRAQFQIAGISAGLFNAIAAGGELRLLASVFDVDPDSEEGLWLASDLLGPDGEVDRARIPGMRVAVDRSNINSSAALSVDRWLRTQGHTVADVEFVPLSGADILLALEQGAIDMGYLLSPIFQQAVGKGYAVHVGPPIAASYYLTTQTMIDTQRPVVEAVMRALTRTVRTYLQGDYHADPTTLAALATVLQVPEAQVAATPALTFDPDMGIDPGLAADAQRMWIENQVLDYSQPFDVTRVFDPSVIQDVLAGR